MTLDLVKGRLLKVLLFTFSFLVLTRFQIDPDFGWHLALGEQFLKHGQIVNVDNFSWTMQGYLWGNSYLFYELLVTYLFKNFGFFALAALFGMFSALGIVVITHKKLDDPFKLFFIVLGSVVAVPVLGVRPHTISFLMFCLLLFFLEKGFFKKRFDFVFWFFFFALWANFHRGFLVGIVVFALYIFLEYFRAFSFGKKIIIWPRAASIVFAVLGTFLTTTPFLLWKSAVFEDLSSKSNLLSIAEWQSIAFYFPVNLIFVLTGVIFIFILFRKFKEVEPEWFLIASFLFALAFVAVTFAFYWAAIFVFLASRCWDFKIKLSVGKFERFLVVFFTLCAILVIILGTFENFLLSYDLGQRLLFDSYPVGAVDYLQKNNLTEGLFNEYIWGGFIDWQMPESKVFIDGRMASWRLPGEKGILNDYINIYSGKCESMETYDIRTVLVKKDVKTPCFTTYTQVYEDSVAKVLVKEDAKR